MTLWAELEEPMKTAEGEQAEEGDAVQDSDHTTDAQSRFWGRAGESCISSRRWGRGLGGRGRGRVQQEGMASKQQQVQEMTEAPNFTKARGAMCVEGHRDHQKPANEDGAMLALLSRHLE